MELTLIEKLTIGAIFAGPIVAVILSMIVNAIYQSGAAKRNAKMYVLGQAISYRHNVMNVENVRALNTIDLVFSRQKDKQVRRYWKAFIDGMRNDGVSAEDRLEKYNELVTEMCKALGYGKAFGYLDATRVLFPKLDQPADDPAAKELQQELLRVLKASGKLAVEPREGAENQT